MVNGQTVPVMTSVGRAGRYGERPVCVLRERGRRNGDLSGQRCENAGRGVVGVVCALRPCRAVVGDGDVAENGANVSVTTTLPVAVASVLPVLEMTNV